MPAQYAGVEFVVEVSDDGTRIAEGAFVEGQKQGLWRTRYRDGRLAAKGLYLEDRKEELWVEWSESGQMLSARYYWEGEVEGPWIVWDSSGAIDLEQSGLFEDGVRGDPLSERWIRSTLKDVERLSEVPRLQ